MEFLRINEESHTVSVIAFCLQMSVMTSALIELNADITKVKKLFRLSVPTKLVQMEDANMHWPRYYFASRKSILQFDVFITWVKVITFLKMRRTNFDASANVFHLSLFFRQFEYRFFHYCETRF